MVVWCFSLFSCSGVAGEREAAGRVWDEASDRLPADRTSGSYLASVAHDALAAQRVGTKRGKTHAAAGVVLVDARLLPALIRRLPSTPQGLPDYTKWLTHYSTKKQDHPAEPITCRSYARCGQARVASGGSGLVLTGIRRG